MFDEFDNEISKEDFLNVVSDGWNDDETTTVLEEEETTIDNQPAYKYLVEEYQYEEEDTKQIIILTYRKKRMFGIMYYDRKSNFNDSEQMGEEMINSFEFLY
ncbi:MAG: hypothetical protein R6V14_00145 [Halanaerobiales bacterium]